MISGSTRRSCRVGLVPAPYGSVAARPPGGGARCDDDAATRTGSPPEHVLRSPIPHPPLVTTRFDATSTADDVVVDMDLTGVRAVGTGASSASAGRPPAPSSARAREVTLAVRNPDAGAEAARDITASTGNDRVRVAVLDLADRAAVAHFEGDWRGPLHLLVDNAGAVLRCCWAPCPLER